MLALLINKPAKYIASIQKTQLIAKKNDKEHILKTH